MGGGIHEFGPVHIEPNEPAFHAAWEGRVLALQGSADDPGSPRAAASRCDSPSEQSSAHYYEDWLSAFESLLLAQGVTQPDEFAVRVKEYQDLRRDPIF